MTTALALVVILLMALSVGIFLVLIRLGVVRWVPAADVAPLDLASLMLGASSLVVTGVGIAVAIGAFFGFERLSRQSRFEIDQGIPPRLDSPMATILHHQARVPVDVEAIAEDMGLVVRYVPMGPGRSGAIYRNPQSGGEIGFTIEIDSEECRIRQRFTLAHEIAHYALHRDLLREGEKLVDNALYRSQLSTTYEDQANRLAADIVMPKNRVRQQFGEDPDPASLARRFEVSEQAMAIRLKHLGLI